MNTINPKDQLKYDSSASAYFSPLNSRVIFVGYPDKKFSIYVPNVCVMMQHADIRAEAASLSVYLFI